MGLLDAVFSPRLKAMNGREHRALKNVQGSFAHVRIGLRLSSRTDTPEFLPSCDEFTGGFKMTEASLF